MKIMATIFILCLILHLGGCKKEPPKVKRTPSQSAQQTVIQKTQQPTIEAVKDMREKIYEYNPKGRRDPFLSLVEITKKPTKKIGASPIESFSIEEFVLMAIASDEEKNYALIMLPDQKTFTITEGMKLGLEGGTVKEITAETVVIREYIKDFKGNIKPKDTVLKLHKGGK